MSALARPWLLPVVALLAIAALAGACGGGDQATTTDGVLTDPRSVPTATPWAEAPEPIFLEEGAVSPIGGGGESPGGSQGECDDPYIVEDGDNPGLIAEKCGVDLDQLLEANPGLDPANLHVGDEINLP